MAIKKENRPRSNFSKITISLASPDSILERSFGEVLKPETINYRTYKPERDGLFCERIFGPVKDYECACGKYKRIRYKGIVCDRCGVEVTEKKVRRERMGHIKLVVPVIHIWYFKSLPNKIGYLLGMSSKKLESIIYYERYVVIQPGLRVDKGQNTGDLLTEEEYLDILETLPKDNQYLPDEDPNKFVAKMGAEAVHDLLGRIDLDGLSFSLRNAAANETSQQRKADALKRLSVVEAFRDANLRIQNRPECQHRRGGTYDAAIHNAGGQTNIPRFLIQTDRLDRGGSDFVDRDRRRSLWFPWAVAVSLRPVQRPPQR